MRIGGDFGADAIRHFNGSLFESLGEPLSLSQPECATLLLAARKNWAEIDPSIFGTLFERSLDADKRAQLGAHYTSRADIETLVEPVVLEPLRAEWDAVRRELEASNWVTQEAAWVKMEAWLERLGAIRVLDPACGSGAFLYVALERLLDLEARARLWWEDYSGQKIEGRIRPEHFLGLEINTYAHDLAQITVWIGFLQWQRANGYPFPADPILRHTENIQHCDALLEVGESGEIRERVWPPAEFIVGNPPFLGGSRLWRELGRDAQNNITRVFAARVPGGADLCCYWFEKARAHIEAGHARRAGLVATQAIRGGANREVLKRIKGSGDIFFAVADRDWTLDGANVHISLVGFDDGSQTTRQLDSLPVENIFPNLTGIVNLTSALPLRENAGLCFIGTKKAGDFNLSQSKALAMLGQPNPHGRPNSDVLRPWANGMSLVQRPDPQWIIDPGVNMTRQDFELYEQPYFLVDALVRPERASNNETRTRENWWLYKRTAPEMRVALKGLPRYLATPRVSKYRVFVWLPSEVLPDDGIFIFARSDDYFFGVLHSRVHELWARATGTQVREAESGFRYTPTTCFDPFPFPDETQSVANGHHFAISTAAARLNELRENYLNPPDWMREETTSFRASLDGPWGHLVQDADARGMGTATWTRLALRPELLIGPMFKRERTLTHLYNTRPSWLRTAHNALDAAVLAAYGLLLDAEDDAILAHLLELNRERAGENATL